MGERIDSFWFIDSVISKSIMDFVEDNCASKLPSLSRSQKRDLCPWSWVRLSGQAKC